MHRIVKEPTLLEAAENATPSTVTEMDGSTQPAK